MKILDRHILFKFLSTFFFCILLLTLIVVVIDISEKTDDFVNSGLSAWRIFIDYYCSFIPHIDAMLFPLFTFIAVIFFTSRMAGRTEIVAIVSSGVSLRRFLLPYWIGAIFLGGMLWAINHTILPAANKQWSAFESRYVAGNLDYTKTFTGRNYYFRVDSNSYAGLRYWDTISKTGSGFFIQKVKNNRMVYNLRCDNIGWDTTQKKWKLTGVTERILHESGENVKRIPSMLVQYNFRPRDLRRDDFLKDRMPTKELDEQIRLQQLSGIEGINDLLVERYNRDAIPVSVIILTMIGAVLASKKVRGGSGAHLAVGVIISVVYVLFSRLSVVFSTKGNFPPLLAAWMPNIIFGLIAYYLYRKAAK